MGKSNIEWTNETWNPSTGCTKVSPGCAHCYAEQLTKRYAGANGWPATFLPWTPANAAQNVVLHPDRLDAPLHWRTPRMVFVDSMSDLFHENVPDEYIDRVFAVMALTPQHTYQVLTKRPARMREYMTKERTAHFEDGSPVTPRNPYTSADFVLWAAQAICDAGWPGEYPTGDSFDWPLPNVWLGVTVENQRWADERIPILLDTPAAVHFVSYEPALGPVSLPCAACGRSDGGLMYSSDPAGRPLCSACAEGVSGPYIEPYVDWLIVGGESGPHHRPFNPQWARDILIQCQLARIPCFVKQLGGARPGNKLDDLPEDLRVREFPR